MEQHLDYSQEQKSDVQLYIKALKNQELAQDKANKQYRDLIKKKKQGDQSSKIRGRKILNFLWGFYLGRCCTSDVAAVPSCLENRGSAIDLVALFFPWPIYELKPGHDSRY